MARAEGGRPAPPGPCWTWGWLLVLLLGLPLGALDPSLPLDRFRLRVWAAAQDFPNNINAALQTRDGYIWVGTYEGVARFDGLRFTFFSRENTPAFPSNTVRCLFQDRDGNLWIGAGEGLVQYRDGVFRRVPLPGELPDDRVHSLAQDPEGTLWIKTRKGLLAYGGGGFRTFQPPGGKGGSGGRGVTADRAGRVGV